MSEFGENKIWSPEDIVNNASSWSLAADKELLRHLQCLSEKILSGAAKTNENLVGLLDELDNTGLSLDLANIELETLHHTQFIESRVYEDDDEFEADETKDAPVAVNKEADEEKIRQEINEGILAAVKAVEEYYEYKEVPNSDSDDENDSPNYVWQPKDPYLIRPLPYVIGTTEWYRKWHVGLLEDSSDDEEANLNENAAETVKDDADSQSSDDERYLPQLDRSSTMAKDSDNINNQWRPSDINNIERGPALNPLANSTLVSAAGDSQFISNAERNSLPIKEPNASFAEQLAKKLDNVAQARELCVPPEINARPIQKAKPITNFGIFLDEPPPLNDNSESSDDDGIFGKPGSSNGALFGRSEAGLFDDLNENESYWGQSKAQKQNEDVPKATLGRRSTSHVPPAIRNIFDDDLFIPKPGERRATTIHLPESSTALPLFDDEPPPMPVVQKEKKKKPIGGVSIFGNADIMKASSLIKNLKKRSSSDSSESTPELDVASSINKPQVAEKVINKKLINNSPAIKKPEPNPRILNKEMVETSKMQPEMLSKEKAVNLFDESDGLFEDDLFSDVSKTKFTSSLFDDDDTIENDSSSLFYTSQVSTVKKSDYTNDLNKDKLQKSHKSQDLADTTKTSTNQNKDNVDIFGASISVLKSDLFSSTEPLFNESIDKSIKNPPPKLLGLFEDNVNSNNDSAININKVEQPTIRKSLFDDSTTEKVTRSDDEQPIPTKRRNLFEDEDLTSAVRTMLPSVQNNSGNIKPSNLFDDFEESPSLFNEDDTEKSLFDKKEIVKEDEDVKIEVKTSVRSDEKVEFNEDIKVNARKTVGRVKKVESVPNFPPVLTIPIKNVEFIDDIPQKILEDVVQSVLEPELPAGKDAPNQYITPPLFDSPPDIEDDFDTDSEQNLFNDENHLIYDDDFNDVSLPVHKVSIFDDVPPLLPNEHTENKIINPPPEATSTDGRDNYESLPRDISVDDDYFTPQLNRSTLSIHERLNRVRTPVFDKDMEETKGKIVEEQEDKIINVIKAIEDNDKLENKPVEIVDLDSSPKKIGVPGKIKHDLNINVAALIPGASRKTEVTTEAIKSNELDELDNTTEILQCITKDRVKIPIKRRPSTRKARKDISSVIFEENLVVSDQIENNNNITIANDIKELPIQNTNLDDIEPIPHIEKTTRNLIIQSETKGAVKKTTTKKPSLFTCSDSSSDDGDDIFKTKPEVEKTRTTNDITSDIFNGLKAQSLFDKQPVIKGDVFESPDYKKSKIFFDDDDENVDDYFSSNKLPPKSNIMKKNLFDDEEEGDDLFQSTMFKNEIKPAKILGPAKKSSKTTPLYPVADTIDDPLKLFK